MSRRARLWPLVALVVAIASIAFVLSFDALRTLGMACGVSPALAWMFPLIIDLPVIAFTWATWVFKTRHLGQAYPWAMLVVFSLVSLAGNALHAHPTETNGMLLPQWGASLLMTMPAVALLATSHMIVKSAAKSFDDDEAPVAPEPILSETDRMDLLYGMARRGLEEGGYGTALDAVVAKGATWGMEPSACRAVLDHVKADMEPPAAPVEEPEQEPFVDGLEPPAPSEEPAVEPEPPAHSEEPPIDEPQPPATPVEEPGSEPEPPVEEPEPPAAPEPVAPKVINDQWRDRMKASADALDHLYALSGPES